MLMQNVVCVWDIEVIKKVWDYIISCKDYVLKKM